MVNKALTTSLEFRTNTSKSIVMISDVGENDNYGPENISSEFDMEILSNWVSNLRGTDLLSHVFKKSPHAVHFVDPADIESRRNEFEGMQYNLANIDVISINENEYTQLARAVGIQIESVSERNLLMVEKSVRILAKNWGLRQIHTQNGSIWSDGKDVLSVKSFRTKPQISTGASDSWDAVDLLGYLSGSNPYERLLFSNAYASLYICNPNYELATKDEVLEFLQSSECDQMKC